jgi:hypothetical protein
MKRFSEQFYTKAQSVKLQAVERDELRVRIVSYMEYHPIEGVAKVSTPKQVDEGQFQYVRFPFTAAAKWSMAVAAFVLVTVPVLAERSVPGETLFAVKVRFNEELISTLKLTPYEKVEWETERLNRRIAEARLLATEGKLTEEVEAEIVAAVQEHTESAEAGIEALRADDVDQATLASLELNTTLQMQSEALQGEEAATMVLAMVDESALADSSTVKLAEVLSESLSKQEAEADIANLPAYEKIMARVEINTTRAYELLKSQEAAIDQKQQQDVTRRLEDVNRTIERANGMRGQNDDVASEILLEALQRTMKIIVFMSDTGAHSDIETVVPVEYTEDEYKQQLVALNEDVSRKIEMITILNPQVSAAASEKALYAIAIAKSNEAIIASSTEAASAVKLVSESVAVLEDALRIFEGEGVGAHTLPAVPVTEEPIGTTTEAVLEEENTQPSY